MIFSVLGGAGFLFKEQIGKFAWEKSGMDGVASVLNPNDAAMHFEMGNFYFNGGAYDLPRAKKYFARTIELDWEFPAAHYQLGRIYFLKGKFFSAMEQMNIESVLRPDFDKVYYMKGLIAGYQGLSDFAADNFKKFLAFNPDNWAGWNDLAWVYFKKGDYVRAKEAAESGISAAGENAWLLTSLGVALLNLGDNERAVEVLISAREMAEAMTPDGWGRAYPGNNPNIYAEGLRQMREAIEYNLELAKASVENSSGGKENTTLQ